MINLLFQLLFFFTPIIFTTNNSEFFEIPKMYFVYAITVFLLIAHTINFVRGQAPLFKKNVFTWPLLIFLTSQIVSTIFSIDLHTSIFGYYSRLNGGLLSLLSYATLFYILSIYIDEKLKQQIIISSLFSGLIVSGFGILEHFGIDKNVWVQDVQTRVFSTLGQPNWLAAYICILLPLSLEKSLNSKKYIPLFLALYTCLLYTKSKSGIIAALVSIGILGLIYFIKNTSRRFLIINFSLIAVLSLVISSPIKDRILPTPTVKSNAPVETNLNITPSEDIRKIVWQGSLELWQQFPLFGTGPETFAYSYYWTRPASHNLTSEWNFLYNKAHNEYLNYMATTGLFGMLSYLFLILVICYQLFKHNKTLFASFVSILITNFAGFSVVVVSLYFFLIPALITTPEKTVSSPKSKFYYATLAIFGFFFIKILFYYLADISYAMTNSSDDKQQYQAARQQIEYSLSYRPNEPLYLSKHADILAKIAINNQDKALANESDKNIKLATSLSPFNLNLWKESAQTYYYLSTVDSNYYLKALESLTKATKLAPTDAMSFYLLGKFYQNISATDQALENYQAALNLKPNYDYASFAIGKIYYDQKKYTKAVPMFEKTLQIAPSNIDAKNYLNIIATGSGNKK